MPSPHLYVTTSNSFIFTAQTMPSPFWSPSQFYFPNSQSKPCYSTCLIHSSAGFTFFLSPVIFWWATIV